ncbi:MAG: QueT transporter family protein [Eubacteriales bacterium]|nr:QueT transporter family protein [Eubacteriales bacterium]
MKQSKTVFFITRAAIIAALYAVVTTLVSLIPGLNTLSFGPIQVRISEALTVLPALTPAAIPGLFLGCVLSNLVGMATSGVTLIDVIFGSLATLAAAGLSYLLRRHKWLVPLPPVIVNALVVGWILNVTQNLPFWMMALSVGAGQAIACYGLGMPLLALLKKKRFESFFRS